MKPKLFLQKKRKAPQRGFRFLHASTTRKRQRAATANADEMDEVPNFGVMSALVVILVLHLVAIGAIYVHNKLNGGETYVTVDAEASSSKSGQPKLDDKYEHYLFVAGDSYELIARKKGVDLEDLKKVNGYQQASAGQIINLPLLKEAEKVTPEVAALPEDSTPEPPIRPTSRPNIQVNDEIYTPAPEGELVEIQPAGSAVLLKPSNSAIAENLPAENSAGEKQAGRAIVIEEATPEPARNNTASGKTHTIQSGDTIWRISRKYGVDQNALMRLNGISDPSRISIGKVLKIPN